MKGKGEGACLHVCKLKNGIVGCINYLLLKYALRTLRCMDDPLTGFLFFLDINECVLGTHGCPQHQYCLNIDGWYTCESDCPHPFYEVISIRVCSGKIKTLFFLLISTLMSEMI